MKYVIEWLDWDYKLHRTTISQKKAQRYEWYDKRQIPSSQREKVREILQRYKE